MTVRPPPTTAPATTACLRASLKSGYQGGKVRDGRVVVERRQKRGTKKQRHLGQPTEYWTNPPALQSPVHHQAGQKEPDQQRRSESHLGLVVLSGAHEREIERKPPINITGK